MTMRVGRLALGALALAGAMLGATGASAARRFDYSFTASLTNGDRVAGNGQFVTGREYMEAADTVLEITRATGTATYDIGADARVTNVTAVDGPYSISPSALRSAGGVYRIGFLDISFDGPPNFLVLEDGGIGFTNDGVGVVADFVIAPLAAAGGVPEPAGWTMMIGGFGLAGAAMRRRRAELAFA